MNRKRRAVPTASGWGIFGVLDNPRGILLLGYQRLLFGPRRPGNPVRILEKHTAVWHMGVNIPCAPESRALLIIHSSAQGTRIMGLDPSLATVEDSFEVWSAQCHYRGMGRSQYIIVVLLRDQSVFAIYQHPGKRRSRRV